MGVNIGVIGCGRWGIAHIKTLNEIKERAGIGQIYASDIDDKSSKEVSRKVDGFFQNWQEMVDKKHLDIVAVVTPPESHAEISVELLSRGIDVLVEKPIATNLADATLILNASQTFGRVLSVGHLLRFHVAIKMALSKISSGLIGALERIEFTRITPREPTNSSDVFQALAIHGIDTSCFCFGELEPQRTHLSHVKHSKFGKPIFADILLEFSGQKEAEIKVAWGGKEEQRTVRFFGEKGSLLVDLANHSEILHDSQGEFRAINTDSDESPLELEWIHTISMSKGNLVDGKTVSPSQGAILRSIRMVEHFSELSKTEFDKINQKPN